MKETATKTHRVRLIEFEHGGKDFAEIVREKLAAGCSITQMAREFGCARITLYDWCDDHGIEIPAERTIITHRCPTEANR